MKYEMLIKCIFHRTHAHKNMLVTAMAMHRNEISVLKWLQSCRIGRNRLLLHYSNWLWSFNRQNTAKKDFIQNIDIIHFFYVDGFKQVITTLISCSLL
jgi:hypothetical protein